MNSKSSETLMEKSPSRQCERRRVDLRFKLGGIDDQGRFFEESIITHDLSECGGSFSSPKSIRVGSTLKLADASGFISLIHIAWSRTESDNNRSNYGFRFIDPLKE